MNKQNQIFQAIIGHLLDLYKVATFEFSNAPHSYTKFRAIKSAQKTTRSTTFIETGTYLGVTTKRCAPLFKKVYTIELDNDLAEKSRLFLAPQKNVQVIQGDALEALPEILAREEVQECLIFLDGHFSGGVTACGSMPEPAIEELQIIEKFKEKINSIIIDDFRLFGTEPGFPSKACLFEMIESKFPEFTLTVHLDQILLKRNFSGNARQQNNNSRLEVVTK
jgi:hypothetical protein